MDIIHRSKVEAACGCTSCVNLQYPQVHTQYEDKLIYFCNEKCLQKFEKDPDAFFSSSHFKINYEDLDSIVERFEVNVSEKEKQEIEEHQMFLQEL